MFRFLSRLVARTASREPHPTVNADADSEWEPAGQRGRAKNFLPSYPSDFQIYLPGITLAGITFRKEYAPTFAHSRNQTIELEREEGNSHDRNAIKVNGACSLGRAFIGYVPKDVAVHIVRSGMLDVIRPRLDRIFESDTYQGDPYLEIRFQIVGPKVRKAEFAAAARKRRTR